MNVWGPRRWLAASGGCWTTWRIHASHHRSRSRSLVPPGQVVARTRGDRQSDDVIGPIQSRTTGASARSAPVGAPVQLLQGCDRLEARGGPPSPSLAGAWSRRRRSCEIADRVERRLAALVDAEQARWAGARPRPGAPRWPRSAACWSSGGKRLRPAFCHWGFVGAGGDPDDDRSSTPARRSSCCTPSPCSTTT